ncbi:MAG: hypothetical protein ACQEXE_26910 [Bacillota bacterium]|uniref:hypothetical protein n=1 Tax=Bacillales TaxID=1385 RepID=UPI00096F5ADB|nr:hypothetical protein [Paenibacillus sp. FSL R5-0490]OMF51749.1 hypothetical protein BK139_23125 [Paenibacillus sp. FSL R5-0490]
MKRSTKLTIVFFIIIGAFMFNFSSETISENTLNIINNIGMVIFLLFIGIMVFDAFRKEK